MDVPVKRESLRYTGLSLTLAVAIGIVGSHSLAAAAGFSMHQDREQLQFLCGLVLFFLALYLLRFLFQLGGQIVARLARVRERPKPEIAMIVLASGMLCVLGALAVVWHAGIDGVSTPNAMELSQNNPGANMMPPIGLSVQATGSLLRPLAVAATLLIGSVLLALGFWSSLPPAPLADTSTISPEASDIGETGGNCA